MDRILMISDIHGCVAQLTELLELAAYNPAKDKLLLLGDYVDRGPHSKETVEKVIELVANGAIALRGNHDQRLVDLVQTDREEVAAKFRMHGGLATLRSYCGFAGDEITDQALQEAKLFLGKNYMRHIEFLGQLPLYYEDHDHIYVHAGINPLVPDWKEQSEHDFMYIKDAFYHSPNRTGKTIVFGHTRTADLHDSADVWFADGKIGIDGGCAYGMQLNCLIRENKVYSAMHIQ
ncbi:serine/threonine protein phosphatase [Paenibacillaceae bacterium]|nr:serine/threonine protein phosphatase [Paenibacillaceae bacterium]